MKAKEQRKVKGYKIAESQYKKAMRRAKKEKLNLATLIEVWVLSYGNKVDYLIDKSPITETN